MALDPGTQHQLLAGEGYKYGPIDDGPMQAEFSAIKRMTPAARAMATGLRKAVVSDANGTAQSVKAAAGQVYHLRVENTDNDAIIVRVLDSTIVRLCIYCAAGSAGAPGVAELAPFGDASASPGAGTPFATSINVTAVKASDGSTAADSGNTVKILYS